MMDREKRIREREERENGSQRKEINLSAFCTK